MGKAIVLLVGAGAVENAWNPVVSAIIGLTNRDVDCTSANTFFAQMIYTARFYSKITHPAAPENLRITLDNIKIIKDRICKNLMLAQENGEIKARPELQTIFSKFILPEGSSFALVSTNWDTVIEDKIKTFYPNCKDLKCVHLHGDIKSDLYLPTETSDELYHTSKQVSNFAVKHIILHDILSKADTLIIYGLSMSPLDAELLQSLYPFGQNKDIIIVDPNFDFVVKNLKAITDFKNLNITAYSPHDFETEVRY